MITLRKTSLFEEHKKCGGKLVEFAGFEMPVQYEGIIAEHNIVRKKSGVFDVSHMGEFLVSGKDALNYLNYLVPNNVTKIEEPGTGLYTQICNEKGGTVDDLIIYKLETDFLVVVNASNIEKDWSWFNSHKSSFDIKLQNLSDKFSLLALQGPDSQSILGKALNISMEDLSTHKYFQIKKYNKTWIARTGYTGEDGFEIFIDNPDETVNVWNKLLGLGAKPCGLGARDTLRLESAYPLYGHELTDDITPLEAGLGWSIKLEKDCDFIGKQALLKQKTEGLKQKMVCLKINDKLIARQGYKVVSMDKREIGFVASGSQGITVGYPIATAFIPPTFSEIGTELFVNIREKLISATVVKRPFYKRA